MFGMRNMMVSTLAEDYVLTAEAKGLRPRRVLTTYAARNAAIPSIAGFSITLGFVVAGSIVMEQVFTYPGIGVRSACTTPTCPARRCANVRSSCWSGCG